MGNAVGMVQGSEMRLRAVWFTLNHRIAIYDNTVSSHANSD
jgi:hypothetical protein